MANEITGLRNAAMQPTQAKPIASGLIGAQTTRGNEAGSTDKVTLTDSARLMQRLEAAVANAPSVDQKRIDDLKQQIANGAYHVDPHRVAQQVTQFEHDTPPVQRDVDASRTDNGYTWDVTWTTDHGTIDRNVTVGFDEATGTLSRDTAWTGPNGETVSRHGQIQMTDSGYVKQQTFTTRDGESVSRSLEVTRDPENHTVTRVRTVDGIDHDFTRTTTISQSSTGLVIDSDIEPVDNTVT